MSDGPIVFEDDDAGYLTWCRDHSGGYVINALRGSYADPVLHRAECRTIQVQTGDRTGWTTYYIKACADDAGDLTMWSYQQGAAPRDCPRCDPRAGRLRAKPRKARTASTPATPTSTTDWLARLAANDATEEIGGRRLIEWAGEHDLMLAFTKPAGSTKPESLVISLALPRGNVGICSTGVVSRSTFLDGDELTRTKPFTTTVGYADLLARVQDVPGMRPTAKGRYPNIPTRDLSDDETWASFTKVFDWILAEVRRSDRRR